MSKILVPPPDELRRFGDLRRRGRTAGSAYSDQQVRDRRAFATHFERAVGDLEKQGWTKARGSSHGEWYLKREPLAARRAIQMHITPADWVLSVALKAAQGYADIMLHDLRKRFGGKVAKKAGAHPIWVNVPLAELLVAAADFPAAEEAVTKHILEVASTAG